jgi:hypothetical protein
MNAVGHSPQKLTGGLFMRRFFFLFTAFISLTQTASASASASALDVESINQIICKDVSDYSNIKIFTKGTLAEVENSTNGFLLTDYNAGNGSINGNQQYYFEADSNILYFSFIADWKAHGQIEVNTLEDQAPGHIIVKETKTKLTCSFSLID